MGDNILVTGFGPFKGHDVNASWEAVKLLPKEINGFKVIAEEIEVSYSYVEKTVPELWKKYNPKLVVHVGVSSIVNSVTIETCAKRKGYQQVDCKGKTHNTGKVCSSNQGEDCIFGSIDPHKISDIINTKDDTKVITSTDAGRYLCEFTYYVSLNIDRAKTMFIHVPQLGEEYSAQKLADIVTEIIKCALDQTCTC